MRCLLQTGQVVAIKKIRLGKAKEVGGYFQRLEAQTALLQRRFCNH